MNLCNLSPTKTIQKPHDLRGSIIHGNTPNPLPQDQVKYKSDGQRRRVDSGHVDVAVGLSHARSSLLSAATEISYQLNHISTSLWFRKILAYDLALPRSLLVYLAPNLSLMIHFLHFVKNITYLFVFCLNKYINKLLLQCCKPTNYIWKTKLVYASELHWMPIYN